MRTNKTTTTTKTIAHDRISLVNLSNGCNNIPTPTGRLNKPNLQESPNGRLPYILSAASQVHLISNAADVNSNSPQIPYPYLKDVLYLKS